MAETLETIRTRMQNWLSANETRLPDAVATDCINLVQMALCRKYDLRFFEVSDTFVTVAGTQSYALPATWSRPYKLEYMHPVTNKVVELKNTSKEKFDRLFPNVTDMGSPSYYMVWGEAIFLGPTPDQVYTITRNYYRYLPDLVDGAPNNTNALVTRAWDVLFYGGLVEATAFMMEDPRLPLWEERYRRTESDLVSEHARAWGSGRVAQSEEPG